MEKKSVSKNYLYNMAYQVLAILLPLITTPYLSRVLGAESIGIYSYTYSIATYFVLFGTLGVALYGQREIAYVQDNPNKRSIVFWEVFLLKCFTMMISVLIYYLSFCLGGQYKIYYRILLIELLTQTLDIIWFFRGIEEFKKTVIRNLIVKAIFFISIFVFIKSATDLTKYVFIVTLANLIGNCTLWAYVPKYIEKIRFSDLHIFRHFKSVILLFIPQIAVQIYTMLDKTMIGYLVADKSETGYYEQAQKIINILTTLITSLGVVMVPRMASTFAKGDKEQLKKYMYNSFRFVFFLAFPIVVGLIIVADKFVPLFFGEGYDRVIILMRIIAPVVLFVGMSNILGTQYLLPVKKQKEYTISVVIGALLNFATNLLLIPSQLAVGASITTIMAEATVVAIQFFFIRKEFNILEILKLSIKNIMAVSIMALCIVWLGFLNINPVICMGLQIIIGAIAYGISLLVMKDEFLRLIFEKLQNKIKFLLKIYNLVWKEDL